MVFIDIPLDIAMARRFLRDFTTDAENFVKGLDNHLSSYLDGGRLLFLELENQIKGNCDIVLDGLLTVDELAATIRLRLRKLWPTQLS